MSRTLGRVCAAVVACFAGLPASDGGAGGGPGSAFGDNLRLTNTAWALGFGEAMVASATGVSAISLNPAGVLESSIATIHLTHTFFVQDLGQDYAAFSQRLPGGSAVGVGLYGLHGSSIPRTTEDAEGNYSGEIGTYAAGFFAGGVAYALDLGPLLGPARFLRPTGGAGLRVVWQRLESRQWLGMTVDLGFRLRPGGGFTLGGVLQNAGVVSGSFQMPLQWIGGVAWQAGDVLCNADRVLLEADSPVAIDRDLSVRIGAEYAVRFGKLSVAVRGGWKEDIEVLGAPGLSGGLGFRWFMGWTPWGIDYALVPWGALGNMHAVALTVGLIPRATPEAKPASRAPKPDRPEPPVVFYPLRGEKAEYVVDVTERSMLSAVVLDEDGILVRTLLERRGVQPGRVTISWDGFLPDGVLAEYEKTYRIRIELGPWTWYKEVVPRRDR